MTFLLVNHVTGRNLGLIYILAIKNLEKINLCYQLTDKMEFKLLSLYCTNQTYQKLIRMKSKQEFAS